MTEAEKRNNVFASWLAADCFKSDIIEKVFNDWKKWVKPENVNREEAYDALIEFFQEFEWSIDEFLDEEFEEEQT